MRKEKMPETMYRASRYCRILGNPTAYMILRSLDNTRKTPTELSKELNISVYTISMTLRNLRQVDLVRYETKGVQKKYWLKDNKIKEVFNVLEKLVERMRKKRL